MGADEYPVVAVAIEGLCRAQLRSSTGTEGRKLGLHNQAPWTPGAICGKALKVTASGCSLCFVTLLVGFPVFFN